jgi:hypothetical protein
MCRETRDVRPAILQLGMGTETRAAELLARGGLQPIV